MSIFSIPTMAPVEDQTNGPTYEPTYGPTFTPTFTPTFAPTFEPTFAPTFAPTPTPSFLEESESWAKKNWYIIVAIAVGFILLISFLAYWFRSGQKRF